jgi:hypothetical protein
MRDVRALEVDDRLGRGRRDTQARQAVLVNLAFDSAGEMRSHDAPGRMTGAALAFAGIYPGRAGWAASAMVGAMTCA